MNKFLNLFTFTFALMQMYVMETPDHLVKKRNYTVDLKHLCPDVPSKTAQYCTKAFNVSKYVSKIYSQEEAMNLDGNPDELPEKWGALMECQTDKLETPTLSLEVYCYFKGMMESHQKFLLDMKSEDAQAEAMKKLDREIQTAKDGQYKDMLIEVRQNLQEAIGNLNSQGILLDAEVSQK